jgi:AcrR family transcriptional regulator
MRATGTDRVIDQAGVTKGVSHRHFPSKNDWIQEFLEYRRLRRMAWF